MAAARHSAISASRSPDKEKSGTLSGSEKHIINESRPRGSNAKPDAQGIPFHAAEEAEMDAVMNELCLEVQYEEF